MALILLMQYWYFQMIWQVTVRDERFEEERFIIIGTDAFARILVVVYTWRSNDIRLISARKATRQERNQYEEG